MRRRDSGAAAVEFALILPAFLGFLFGIEEVGRMFWTLSSIQYACEETGRYAMTNTAITNDKLQDYANTKMTGVNPAITTFTAANDTVGSVRFVTITGTATFNWLVPYIATKTTTLTAKSRVPLIP